MKVLLAHGVLRAIDPDAGISTAEAAKAELDTMYERLQGCGGVVALSSGGVPGLFHTTEKMPWAIVQPELGLRAGMHMDECNEAELVARLSSNHGLR